MPHLVFQLILLIISLCKIPLSLWARCSQTALNTQHKNTNNRGWFLTSTSYLLVNESGGWSPLSCEKKVQWHRYSLLRRRLRLQLFTSDIYKMHQNILSSAPSFYWPLWTTCGLIKQLLTECFYNPPTPPPYPRNPHPPQNHHCKVPIVLLHTWMQKYRSARRLLATPTPFGRLQTLFCQNR